MGAFARGLGSSVGLKFIAAITGLCLALFVIGHMLGNLQVFLGREALNTYAGHLQGLGGALWVIRAILLGILALHIFAVGSLQLRNWSARPVRYAGQKPLKSTFASRTMIWTGLLLLTFIIYHILHFTVGVIAVTPGAVVGADGHKDVYTMVIEGFQQPAVSISYIVAMLLLWLHLKHGITSIFQSMGWNAPKYERLTLVLGQVLSTIIVIGNIAMPLLVLLRVVGTTTGVN